MLGYLIYSFASVKKQLPKKCNCGGGEPKTKIALQDDLDPIEEAIEVEEVIEE